MRINKQIAKDVAEKLLVKKLENWDKLKKDLSEKATELSFTKINPEVVAFQKKYSNYLRNVKSVEFISVIDEKRQQLDRIELTKSVPSPNSDYYRYIELSPVEFKTIKNLSDKVVNAKKDYKNAFEVVEQTIFNLRTAIQLQKHFPEAYALLPKETNGTMLPMVNLDHVRALVSSN